MDWLTISGAIAAMAGLGLVWYNRYRLHRAETALAEVQTQLKFSERAADDLQDKVRELQARLDRIALEDRRVQAGGERADILTAITLMRKGADAASLTGTCGLSRGEARLVGTLYGQTAGPTSDSTAH
ncbi:MAG TPA: hypothetical protein ENK16_06175 [Chromatiales bacterium]|nr:hypothetical protein [Chromatiales bacterium]